MAYNELIKNFEKVRAYIEEVNELCEEFAYDNYKKFWQVASDFVTKHYAEFIGESTMSEQDATMFFFLKLVTTVKETADGAAWGRFRREKTAATGDLSDMSRAQDAAE